MTGRPANALEYKIWVAIPTTFVNARRVAQTPVSRHHKTEEALARMSVFLNSCGSRQFEERGFINTCLELWSAVKQAKAVEVVGGVNDGVGGLVMGGVESLIVDGAEG